MINKKKIVTGALVLVFCVAIYRAFFSGNKTERKSGQNDQAVPVSAAVIENKDMVSRLVFPGDIKPDLKAELSSKITGVIDEVIPVIGQFAEQGETLVRISDNEYREQLNNANISLRLAQVSVEKQEIEADNSKKQYDRIADLYKNALATKENLDNSEAKYKTAAASLNYYRAQAEQEKVRIEQAKINLEYTVIKAPFPGYVEDIFIERGSMVSPGRIILSIINIAKVKVSVDISERYYRHIRKGMPADFTSGGSEKLYHGRVTALSPSIDHESRTAKAEITVENETGELKPGMTAMLRFAIKKFEAIPAVPDGTLYKQDEKTGVFLIGEDDKVTFILVEPEAEENGFIGFSRSSGLKAGQRLVLLGGHLLRTGSRVAVEGEKKEEKSERKKNY